MSGAKEYRKTALVEAVRFADSGTLATKNGDDLKYAAGDYGVGPKGGQWPVEMGIFADTHQRVIRYRKIALVRARQHPLDAQPVIIDTLEGPATCNPGDYVAEGVAGEQWPIPRAFFETNYGEAGAEGSISPVASPDGGDEKWVAAKSFFESAYIPDIPEIQNVIDLRGTEEFRVLASMLSMDRFNADTLCAFAHVPAAQTEVFIRGYRHLLARIPGTANRDFRVKPAKTSRAVRRVNELWRTEIEPRLFADRDFAGVVRAAYASTDELLRRAANAKDARLRRTLIRSARVSLRAGRQNARSLADAVVATGSRQVEREFQSRMTALGE